MKYKLLAICSFVIMVCFVAMYFLFITFRDHNYADFIIIPSLSALSSLVGACFVVLLFDVAIKKDSDLNILKAISKCVDHSVAKSMKSRLYGVKDIHDRFNNQSFIDALKESEKLYILQTYAPNIADLETAISDFLADGGKAKIALLNPKSDFVKIRASETSDLHPTREAFEEKINGNARNLSRSAVNKNNGGQLILAYYDRSPGICMYATEHMMWVAPYLTKKDAVVAPQLEIEAKTKGYDLFLAHFKEIWKDAEKNNL